MNLLRILFTHFSYVSRYIVWASDCFLSVVSTLLSFLFFTYLLSIDVVPGIVWLILTISAVVSMIWTWVCKTNDGIIRHATLAELTRIVYAMFLKDVTLLIIAYIYLDYVGRFVYSIIIVDFILSVMLLMLERAFVVSSYYYVINRVVDKTENALIYGISDAAISLANYLRNSKKYQVIGYVTRSSQWKNYRVAGYRIFYLKDAIDFGELIKKWEIKDLFFVNNQDLHADEGLINYGLKNNVCLRIAPMAEMPKNVADIQMRTVQIEDLLGRDEIKIDFDKIQSNIKDKVVMVTGGAGSIGSELCRQLCRCDFRQLIVLDFSETATYQIDLELKQKFPQKSIVSVIADVRNVDRMDYLMNLYHPNVIFHAAAYKHVPLMEEHPCEAVIDNDGGTKIVADLSVKYGIDKFIMISTDKAVHPSSVMGATKRVAEMYVQSLGEAIKSGEVQGKTTFVTTRFGNVLGSKGSVIPLFREQILAGGPVTVTDPEIIRYFMTIPEACRLVLEAAYIGKSNDIFIFDMGRAVRIVDLAKRMIELSGLRPDVDIKIEFTGLRPGEKLYEELLYEKEKSSPTVNPKIYRANTVGNEYGAVNKSVNILLNIARTQDKTETVRQIKLMVSDYRSLHSKFAGLDAKEK